MAGPSAAEAAARTAVAASVADLGATDLVLVACSGGADSLALAAAAAFVARRPGAPRAGAVVVDHALQPGSDAVARQAAHACVALGLAPVVVRRVAVGTGGGPEGAARAARYAALEAAATDVGAAAVLLAHTLDDQAETVLLALARGSGTRSLAGMAPHRGLWRRPFLALRRAQTEAACRAVGLPWWDDPTNGRDGGTGGAAGPDGTTGPDDATGAGDLPRRSALRRDVLPALAAVLGPGVPAALARTARSARDDADLLDALAADVLAQARRDTPPGGGSVAAPPGASPRELRLDVATLARAPRALRTRALRAAALAAGSPAGALASVHVDELDRLVTAWHGQGPLALPGPVAARRECGTLVLRAPGP